MSLESLIDKIDHFKTTIESIEVLILNHNQDVLKPILIHLNEQRRATVQELSQLKVQELKDQQLK